MAMGGVLAISVCGHLETTYIYFSKFSIMKKLVWIGLLFMSLHAVAQYRKTDGRSGSAHTLRMLDPQRADYFASLIHLDQHPLPAAEYGYKKTALNEARARWEAGNPNRFNTNSKPTATAPDPSIWKSFAGNSANGVPNDNDIAISNNGTVVSVVNSNMRVLDDTGKVLSTISVSSFFSSLGAFNYVSDPRVLYDPVHDRFILVCFSGALSTSSTILVAFSQTNDPLGTWNAYTLNGNSFNDTTWSDYPIIAINDKDLFLTFNQVKDNVSWTIGFKQSVIWQINKADGYNAQPLNYTLWDSLMWGNTMLRNICPAKNQSTTPSNNMYFLTVRNVASTNDSLFLTEITNSQISGQATLVKRLLQTPIQYGFPPNARERKSSSGQQQYLMTNDARVLAAVYENNQVHFGMNTLNPQFMNAGVLLGTIEQVSAATPVVKAQIFSTATQEFGYPSMAYMGTSANDHRLLYTFSHCYTDSFPGTSVLYRNSNGDFSNIIGVKDGSSIINQLADSNDRWGDYTNIQRVYNKPGRAYLAGSYGRLNIANTWIAAVDVNEWPNQINDVASTISGAEIFPNPLVDQRFTLRFNNGSTRFLQFYLMDATGKEQPLMRNTVKAGLNEFSFYVGNLPTGIYFLNIYANEGKIISQRVVVK